ncbi:MAG: hypothetical protein KDA80_21720 [Planctomycetaceae bacterium]|nr:hypothetical protein [Planctomycetaceae bacterium]
MFLRTSMLVASCLLAVSVLGCGGGNSVTTYDLSGNVTFDGQPIPVGRILFTPSGEENAGPAGYAVIRDGKFDTKAEGGKGHTGGAMRIHIEGLKAPEMKPDPENPSVQIEVSEMLFPPYQTMGELPQEESTMDFDVPKTAANRKDLPENAAASGGV